MSGATHSSAPSASLAAHNRVQREYFDTVERSRIAIGESGYVVRHIEETLAAGQFAPRVTLLEVGAGVGRATLPLLARGFDVVANDLSPVLLERLRAAAPEPVRTIACDVSAIAEHLDRPVDGVVGFFMLHHLLGFDATFRALGRVLRPGGRVAFCEPVAWNPLYYLQIAMTPSMRFAGEPSLTRMRLGVIGPAMLRVGFVAVASRRYGYFPPVLKNTPAGDRVERWLERRGWIPFPHAFQVFTGEWLA